MKRKDAIKKITETKIKTLNKDKRSEYLIDWWNINKEDNEFESLPNDLQKEITEKDKFENPEHKKYDPLILMALRHKFKGVKNEYIKRELNRISNNEIQVIGQIEKMEKCPCCGYKTLLERGVWDICEVCYWEDDGIEELNKVSGPNRMTLKQAKENFKRFGACEKRLIQFTEKEPELKYEK